MDTRIVKVIIYFRQKLFSLVRVFYLSKIIQLHNLSLFQKGEKTTVFRDLCFHELGPRCHERSNARSEDLHDDTMQ
jgi:hypothetical protein